jgi:hypothetical protein
VEILLIRTASGAFVPMDDDEAEKLKRIKAGAVVRADVSQMRNGPFFRKWWALAKLAFDIWSETVPAQEYKGVPVRPDFGRFRRDLTIMAGHFRPVFDAAGGMRLEAESLRWDKMSEAEFDNLYSKTIDVCLTKIIGDPSLSKDKLNARIEAVMRFD